jgi:hypothetical protein
MLPELKPLIDSRQTRPLRPAGLGYWPEQVIGNLLSLPSFPVFPPDKPQSHGKSAATHKTGYYSDLMRRKSHAPTNFLIR